MSNEPNPPRPRRRSPFVFDLRELGRRPGAMREYRREVPAPETMGLDLIGVPEGEPVELDLRLESVSEGVLVTGTVRARVIGQCGRCLDRIVDELAVEVVELFAYAHSTTDQTTEDDEIRRVDGERVDVAPVVHEAIVLALPGTPVCRPGCAGLCAGCGRRLDDLPEGHSHDMMDPRWAGLRAFTDAAGASEQ